MNKRGVLWAAVVAVACGACGGIADEGAGQTDPALTVGGETPKTDGQGESGRAAGAKSGGASTSTAAEQCAVAPQGVRKTPTEAAFRAALIGDWYLCSETSAFGTADEMGLALTADGRWHKLKQAAAAPGYTAATGWNDEGSWEVIDTSSMNGPGYFQLNLHIDGSGTVITHPVFAEVPQAMRLNNMGVHVGDYVRVAD